MKWFQCNPTVETHHLTLPIDKVCITYGIHGFFNESRHHLVVAVEEYHMLAYDFINRPVTRSRRTGLIFFQQ